MANTSSSRKSARQQAKRRIHNTGMRSRMRTSMKRLIQAVSENCDREAAEKKFRHACSLLDSGINKHLIHKNKVARHKSQLNKYLQKISA